MSLPAPGRLGSPELYRAPPSAIRAAGVRLRRRPMIDLGLGAPTWFERPRGLPAAARRALESARSAPYGPHAGSRSLRRAIATYEGVHEDQVLVTCGAQGALFAVVSACLGPGDLALVPDPGFPAYAALVRMAGARPRAYSLRGPRFRLDAAEIEKALAAEPRARVLFLNHPSNPTGGGASRQELAKVAAACESRGVLLVCDQVYRELYLESPGPPPGLRQVGGSGVVVGSMSKGWGAPGLRIGWLIADPALLECCRGWHAWAVTSAATPSQAAAEALLRAGGEILATSRRELRRRWRALSEAFSSELGELPPRPDGGCYLWLEVPPADATSEAMCARLAEQEAVTLVPGSAFGTRGEGWARLCFAARLEQIGEGARRVARYLRRRRRDVPGAGS